MDRYFPKAVAIDPEGCGCTECIVGLYVNEERWLTLANAADVQAWLTGELSDNFSDSYSPASPRLSWLLKNRALLADDSALAFLDQLIDHFEEKAPKWASKIDVDALA